MECSIVRDLKRSAGAGMISKKVSSPPPTSQFTVLVSLSFFVSLFFLNLWTVPK